METEDDDSVSQCCDDSLILIRVNVTDLGVQKCMQFHREELVWDVKQQLLATLQKELKESFNYGLYYPPANGKAGKFLDEERPLSDYPFSGPVGYLELKYKRRVYKMMNIDEKQLKQLHTKANLRRLLDFVQGGQAEKISKLCTKGLDPNFHCHETGETPLTLASVQKKCNRVILALANGGALLDFRTRDGCTALHRAVEKNNLEGIKTLLDLGASPNYKDVKGLTPLYSCVLNKADAHICEILLHDHATVGTADHQGWHEVHQACRNGLVQHLEHLLFYGADMNAKNASGNTPLHVCAVNEQESCARVLLFRGANKDALNFANQTPHQVAVIAGNLTLAEIIQNHSPEEVVPFREPPKYNPRRRASIASTSSSASSLNRTHSDPRLEITLGIKPPSPSPSNRSLPPFSSASSLSEASTGSSSTCTTQPSNDDSEDTASASIITEKSVASDSSSGVCCVTTTSSYVTGNYEDGTEHISVAESKLGPGSMCVCVENYNSDIPGHLQLSQGDIIEVTGAADHGLLEGQLKNQQGMFPASCVQEVRLRHIVTQRVEGRREATTCYQQQQRQNPQTQIISPSLMSAVNRFGEPRTVMLRKGKKGFGFVLRGAKATSPLMDMMPTDNCPALQYLDDVDKGGVADLAGLKKGDFLLTINGEDVSQASHEQVVTLIRKSGDLVAMTVVTVQRPSGILLEKPQTMATRQCATLPRKLIRAAPAPPRRDPRTTLSVGRARARSMVAGLAEIEALDRTLMEYDLEGRPNKSGSIESLPNAQQKRGSSFGNPPKGEAVNSLHDQFMTGTTNRGQRIVYSQQKDASSTSENDSRVLRSPKVYGSVAEMKRSRNHRQRPGETSSSAENKIHKLFSSTPDLNDNVDLNTSVITILNKENRKSHSQEDVHSVAWDGKTVKLQLENVTAVTHGGNVVLRTGVGDVKSEDANLPWHSIEEIYERLSAESGGVVLSDDKRLIKDSPNEFGHPPPPTHPPPPPPVGQVVRVDVSRSCGEYARITLAPETSTSSARVMSSFRPGDSAKLYASPQEVCVVGYRPSPQSVAQSSRKPVSCSSVRSRSLPPNVPPPSKSSSPSSSTSSESETSGDSGGYTCSTFKKPCQQTVNVLDDTSTDSGNSSEKGSHVFDSGLSTSTNPYAQPVVPLHHPSSSISLSDGEPFIPEPDYDISDEEEDMTSRNATTAQLQHNGNLRAQPPRPPPLPISAGGSVPNSKVSSHNPLLYGLHSVHTGRRPDDAMQRNPVSGGEKKKPPTPPVKRRDIKENVSSGVATTCVEGYPGGIQPSVNILHCQLAAMTESFNEKTSAVSNIQLQATSPISTAEHSAEERLEKGPTEIPTTFSTLRHIERRNSSGELKKMKDPPPVAWKPPPTGSKAVKSSPPVTIPSSSAASRAEVTEVSNLKQIIAQKAAERQRWVSLTCDVPENAQEVVKEMDCLPAPSTVLTETEELTDFNLVASSTFNQNNSPNQAEDVVVNVKEQISVFEKKVESVKTSPYSVRASPLQRADESRKVLRGSRSQIFENKALEKINNANVKSSKSCPLDLAQDDVDDSSSGVSSDVDTHNDTFIRKEGREVDRMTKSIQKTDEGKNEEIYPERTADVDSDDSDDASDVAWNLRRKIYEKDPMMREDLEVNVVGRRILKKRVVSLTKLPPPIETGETDAESDVAESGLPSNEQSSNGPRNSTPLSTSTVVNSDVSKSSPLPQQQMTSSPPPSDKALARQDEDQKKVAEEEIQYSVKLIEMHANSLQEVNVLAGLVPPPPGFDERTGEEQEVDAIAPPPEFSDDVHIPISALQQSQRQRRRQEVLKLSEDDLDDSAASDLDEAEMAAKSAAAALAAAAGGIHLTCPSFVEWKSSKLHSRSSAPVSSLHAASGQQHYYQHYRPGQTASYDHHQSSSPQTFGAQPMAKTTAKSARKMVQQRPSNAKVRLLPADLQKGVSAACNGVRVSDEMQLPDSSERSMPTADKLKMTSNSVVVTAAPSCPQKEFRVKPMNQWTTKDVSDWLESLFLPEYKAKFEAAGVDGRRLGYLDEDTLLKLGVRRVGHRINIEQSLRRHSTMKH